MKESDKRWTPEIVLDRVRVFFDGDAVLDPCWSADCPVGIALDVCDHEQGDDGLKANWSAYESVWVNPPYSRGQIIQWVTKAADSAPAEILMLLPADLSAAWGRMAYETAQGVAFWRGRIAFGSPADPDGMAAGAKTPSMIVYWGERYGRFAHVFADVASVVQLPNVQRMGGAHER